MSQHRRLIALWLSLALSWAWGPAGAQERIRPAYTAEFIAQMLDYVSRDYALAVAKGRVIDQDEYTEQLVISRSALEVSGQIPALRSDAPVQTGIRRLITLIQAKADVNAIKRQALRVRDDIFQKAGIATSPAHWPSLAQGQGLYSTHCAACHGETGDGQGPAGQQLKPQPANFLDVKRMAPLSPLSVFGTVRQGIQNTPMRAYPELSEDEVWAVSFYVMALGARSQPRLEGGTLDRTAADLWIKPASGLNDADLMLALPGRRPERQKLLQMIRLHPGDQGPSP